MTTDTVLRVGQKVKFAAEKQRYTIQACNERFAVCTKPFNARKTVLYTVVDFAQNVRGTENLIFGAGAESREDCEQMLERLSAGESQISHRNRIPLDIEEDQERATDAR